MGRHVLRQEATISVSVRRDSLDPAVRKVNLVNYYVFWVNQKFIFKPKLDIVCNPSTCFNGGTCVQYSNTLAVCICPFGFSGSNCQNTACTYQPCKNGGICSLSDRTSKYQCTCQSGWTGSNCDSKLNPCLNKNNSPICLNQGVCNINLSVFPYYECICGFGYSGARCQIAPALNNNTPNCQDKDTIMCKIYSGNKFCNGAYYINGVLVSDYCPKSCNRCNLPQCSDSNQNCSKWASMNFCKNYPIFELCKSSCKLC